ncbi:MAG: type II methionyl aminopeptidase [Nanoarchaeota archaeon]|nr:type II methionyl aminopeptidase [Nanoarchaeota archaeon]
MNTFDMDILKELGSLTREIRKEVSSMISTGVDIKSLIDFIEKKIFETGNFPSFPAMVSVNDMAAHYTVYNEGYILQKGDVIKVDFGISRDGFITDNAFTVEVDSNEHEELLACAKACLDAAMDRVEIGCTMHDIGDVVYQVASDRGFNTIHNLSGHQIGPYVLHYGLSVPSFPNEDMQKVENSQQFAIEPFVTYGEPRIKAVRPSNILHLKQTKPVRDPIAMKVLKHIKEHFPKLPFSKRWLVESEALMLGAKGGGIKGYDFKKVNYGISVLKKYGSIYEYDELGTVDGAIVAQFEDCVVFENNEKTIITRLKLEE